MSHPSKLHLIKNFRWFYLSYSLIWVDIQKRFKKKWRKVNLNIYFPSLNIFRSVAFIFLWTENSRQPNIISIENEWRILNTASDEISNSYEERKEHRETPTTCQFNAWSMWKMIRLPLKLKCFFTFSILKVRML